MLIVFYYVVIFVFICIDGDNGYGVMVDCMVELVCSMLGFFGIEFVCDELVGD